LHMREFYLLRTGAHLCDTGGVKPASIVIRGCSGFPGQKRMNDPIRVAIVGSDELVYQRTRKVLESADGITVVGEGKGGQSATDLVRETRPDVILLEIGSRHASNLEIVAQIQELFPRTKIIVFNEEGQEPLVLEAFRQGAQGHLVKGKAQPAEIVEAIRAVNRGEAILSPGLAGSMLDEVFQAQRKSLKEAD